MMTARTVERKTMIGNGAGFGDFGDSIERAANWKFLSVKALIKEITP